MKKLLSILLCAVCIFTFITPAFAAEEKTAFIVVSGMNTMPLYNSDGTKAYPLTGDVTAKMVLKILPSVGAFLLRRDYNALADGILPAIREAFSPLECDTSGKSIKDISAVTFEKNVSDSVSVFESEEKDELAVVRAGIEKFGAENTYFFNYDWRLSPLDHADKLNALIKTAIKETGCRRVSVAAFSMGGTVVCAYLQKYGSADLKSVSLCSTAFQGLSCVGSLFTGDLSFDTFALIRRLAQLTRNDTAEDLIMLLNTALEATGINGVLGTAAGSLVSGLKGRLYKECLIPVFGYMTGIWGMVDDVNYENAKAFMLSNADGELIRKIDYYHYSVQNKAEEILKKAQEDTNVYILAQYNMQGLPVSETASTTNNDYLIDTVYASGGAVCAPLGETLGENYKQKISCGHNHLSADGQIDASTCMMPEYTWFIRDMGHVDYPIGDSTDFILYLAAEKSYISVHDNPLYPQFLKYSNGSKSLAPVDETINNKSVSDKIFNMINYLLELSGTVLYNICLENIDFIKGL